MICDGCGKYTTKLTDGGLSVETKQRFGLPLIGCPSCMNGGPTDRNVQLSDKDKVVVWQDKKGNIRYPGRNDAKMPKRYAKQGFAPVEMRHMREVAKFEKQHGVASEVLNFDEGSSTRRLDE